ncbi:MAG: type II toxin-antitoxin system death-on-curing family toxin [Planctomycetes bacterium]|nr:type II toxin-antitoxin system death-on-curing family toxin [Planctomycetota bacterium]
MAEVRFLTTENVLKLHALSIEGFGGRDGVRDIGLLESAVAMPMAMFGGELLHPDIAAMAGAYLFHMSKSHALLDGNTRTAWAAALVFVVLNGHDIKATNDEVIEIGLAVADGSMAKDALIERLRAMIHPK